ncbi:MAG: nitroreductase family protein [Isosphaeraceae bacterium]
MSRDFTVSEALQARRATRHFDAGRPLESDKLARILELATLAPSGYNLQPWRFLVVRDPRNREKLRQCAFGQAKIAEAAAVLIVLGYHHPDETHLKAIVGEMVRRGILDEDQASAMEGRARSSMKRVTDPELWATRSSMLAAMSLMLAAESLGVQSAPMEGFEDEKVRRAFGIPDDHAICCLICLGFARDSQPFPGRLGLADVCFGEHFGRALDVEGTTS